MTDRSAYPGASGPCAVVDLVGEDCSCSSWDCRALAGVTSGACR